MAPNQIPAITPIAKLSALPPYGFLFFFKNMGVFRRRFWLLTLCSSLGSLLGFFTVYILGDLISHAGGLTARRILAFYLPLSVAAFVLREALDFFIRKYAEPFPTYYGDHLYLRFYRSLLQTNFERLSNLGKERLMTLLSRYVGNVEGFLSGWFWGTARRVTELAVVLVILYVQNPWVLVINSLYFLCFLALALSISARFSPYARAFSQKAIDAGASTSSFVLNLNTVRRLDIGPFFFDTVGAFIGKKWEALGRVADFHAKRWLLQLNLFNFFYLGTLFWGVYQIKSGLIALGFLVLIKYAFDRLWEIMVFIIEYYVALIQQREDAALITAEFKVLDRDNKPAESLAPALWRQIELREVKTEFLVEAEKRQITIFLPELVIKPGDKVGILGPSGSGKSTLLQVLLNLHSFSGRYTIDGEPIGNKNISSAFMSIIANLDYLFKLSVRDNILLGRRIAVAELERILAGTQVAEFLQDLERRVGDPDFHLSAGQEQRVRLARGLLQSAQIYLLDEPFNSIDFSLKRKIMQFLKDFLREKTVILVTHDPAELELVDRVLEFHGDQLGRQVLAPRAAC